MPATTLPMYRRLGSCEPALCGAACCRFVLLEVAPVSRQPDLAAWLGLHGLTVVEHAGRTLVKIPLECSALDTHGRCLLYGRPERPRLCAEYPMTPAALLGVEDVCTFAFAAGPGLALSEGADIPLD